MQIGDTARIVAAPASRYHIMDGDDVTIIGMNMFKNKAVFTFLHSQLGYGAMEAHGFEKVRGKK